LTFSTLAYLSQFQLLIDSSYADDRYLADNASRLTMIKPGTLGGGGGGGLPVTGHPPGPAGWRWRGAGPGRCGGARRRRFTLDSD